MRLVKVWSHCATTIKILDVLNGANNGKNVKTFTVDLHVSLKKCYGKRFEKTVKVKRPWEAYINLWNFSLVWILKKSTRGMSLLILSSFTVVYVWTTSDSDRLRRTEVICLASQKLAWATEKTISVEAAWKNKGRLHFHLVSKQKTFLVQCNPTLRW